MCLVGAGQAGVSTGLFASVHLKISLLFTEQFLICSCLLRLKGLVVFLPPCKFFEKKLLYVGNCSCLSRKALSKRFGKYVFLLLLM